MLQNISDFSRSPLGLSILLLLAYFMTTAGIMLLPLTYMSSLII